MTTEYKLQASTPVANGTITLSSGPSSTVNADFQVCTGPSASSTFGSFTVDASAGTCLSVGTSGIEFTAETSTRAGFAGLSVGCDTTVDLLSGQSSLDCSPRAEFTLGAEVSGTGISGSVSFSPDTTSTPDVPDFGLPSLGLPDFGFPGFSTPDFGAPSPDFGGLTTGPSIDFTGPDTFGGGSSSDFGGGFDGGRDFGHDFGGGFDGGGSDFGGGGDTMVA